jgi:hypothetical protein
MRLFLAGSGCAGSCCCRAPRAFARVWGTAKTLGASFLTNAVDSAKRAALRNSLNTLAEMFTDPQSVELIREALARGAPNVVPEVAARTAAQTAPVLGGSKEKGKFRSNGTRVEYLPPGKDPNDPKAWEPAK